MFAANLTAGRATGFGDRRDAWRVRHSAFCDAELLSCTGPADDAHDRWDLDESTAHYLVRQGDQPVGSARVLRTGSLRGLPVDAYWDRLDDGVGAVELSRAGLAPDWRGDREVALLTLFGAVIRDLWAAGHRSLVVGMRAPMALLLARRGGVPFAVEHVERAAFANGEAAFFARIGLASMAALQHVDRPRAYGFVFGRSDPVVEATEEELQALRVTMQESLALIRRTLRTIRSARSTPPGPAIRPAA